MKALRLRAGSRCTGDTTGVWRCLLRCIHETVSLFASGAGRVVSEIDTIALYLNGNEPLKLTRRRTSFPIGDHR